MQLSANFAFNHDSRIVCALQVGAAQTFKNISYPLKKLEKL